MRTNIFVSYSKKDRAHLADLDLALTDLIESKIAKVFVDREIEVGDRWRREIERALNRMDVAILLITDNFLSSDFISEVELKRIRKFARNRRVIVVPLLLEQCKLPVPDWVFEHQAPIDVKTPISTLDTDQRKGLYYQLAERLKLVAYKNRPVGRFLRRRLFNWRFSIPFSSSTISTLAFATLLSWRLLQPGEVQNLHWTSPSGLCRSENISSAVQVFENGWLLANFGRDEFYAISKDADKKVAWIKTNASGFTKGASDECPNVADASRLKLGFRWFYCRSENRNEVQRLLGKPLTDEIRVLAQYQPWINGLFVYGLPGTVQGVETDHFQVLNGIMLKEIRNPQGTGSFFGHTTGTSVRSEYCTAAWYPIRRNTPVQELQEALIKSEDCTKSIDADFYRQGRLSCSIDGYDDSVFAPLLSFPASIEGRLSGDPVKAEQVVVRDDQ